MRFDLFVTDFDGTLGVAPDFIEEETVKAVKEYVARGGKFAIVTGRMYSSIRPICLKYGFKGIVISYQGAMINDIETGKSLFQGGIDYELASKVAKDFIAEGVQTVVDIDDEMIYNMRSDYTDFYENAVGVKGRLEENLVEYVLKEKKVAQKVGTICSPEDSLRLTQKYQKIYGDKLIINNGSRHLVEVVSPTCSKGVAVKFLANYYNIPLDRVIAVGDSTNDIELLKGEWHGVCVGDGREELKVVAKEITLPYKDKPVKYLLEKYCL